MYQILEFFRKIFSTSDFPPRWTCGNWSSFHGWLYIFSDVFIWLSYFILPLIIIYFIRTRKDLRFRPVFYLFGAFIISCGITHLLDAVIFWVPLYRISAVIKLITAMISLSTVFAALQSLPQALAYEGIEDPKLYQLQKELQAKDRQIQILLSNREDGR